MSNADFWPIAGIVALEMANPKLEKDVEIHFKGGRRDCSGSPGTLTNVMHSFPDPNMNGSEMFQWFKSNMLMTQRQV